MTTWGGAITCDQCGRHDKGAGFITIEIKPRPHQLLDHTLAASMSGQLFDLCYRCMEDRLGGMLQARRELNRIGTPKSA